MRNAPPKVIKDMPGQTVLSLENGIVLAEQYPNGRAAPSQRANGLADPPQRTQLDMALAYAQIGWHVFPCAASKRPLTPSGFKDASTDPEQIEAWWQENPHASIGVACGASGLVVVDCDVGKGGNGIEVFGGLCDLSPHDAELVASTPSGGRHYFYAASKHDRVTCQNRWRAAVDVKAEGGYVIAPGIGDGREWIEGDPVEDSPGPIPEWLLTLLPHGAASAGPNTPPAAASDLRQGASEGSRNESAAKVIGRFVAQNRDMLDLAWDSSLAWNRRNKPPLPEQELRRVFDSIAKKDRANHPDDASEAGSDDSLLEVLFLRDLEQIGEREQVIDGVLLYDSLNVLTGPPKSYKTTIADACSVAVADGSEWLGRKVHNGGLVVDFALEGLASKRSRMKAHVGAARWANLDDPIHRRLALVATLPDITKQIGVDKVCRTLDYLTSQTGEELRLLKLDTLARGMAKCGLDENATKDMSAFIGGLDSIRERFPCAQLVIHHDGKSGQMRGNTALNGAYDLRLSSKAIAKFHSELTFVEARDLETLPNITCSYTPVIVGQDSQGKDVTAMALVSARPSDAPGCGSDDVVSSHKAVRHYLELTKEHGLTVAQLQGETGIEARTTITSALDRMGSDVVRAREGRSYRYWMRQHCPSDLAPRLCDDGSDDELTTSDDDASNRRVREVTTSPPLYREGRVRHVTTSANADERESA